MLSPRIFRGLITARIEPCSAILRAYKLLVGQFVKRIFFSHCQCCHDGYCMHMLLVSGVVMYIPCMSGIFTLYICKHHAY